MIMSPTKDDLAQTGVLPVLGYTTWWKLAGIRIERQAYLDLLVAHGFDGIDPGEITPRTSLRRGILSYVANVYRDKTSGDFTGSTGVSTQTDVSVLAPKNSPYLIFTVNSKGVDWASLGMSFVTRLRIALDRDKGTMFATLVGAGEPDPTTADTRITDAIQTCWDAERTMYHTRDISDSIVEIVRGKLSGVGVRDGGGVYYVPSESAVELEALETLMDLLGSGCFLVRQGLVDVHGAKRSMGKAVHAGLMQELTDLEKDLQLFLSKPAGTVRNSTITAKIKRFKELRSKAEAMGDGLQFRQQDIQQGLSKLTAAAQKLLDAPDTEETIAPDPTPDPDPVIVVPAPVVTPDPEITPDVTPEPEPVPAPVVKRSHHKKVVKPVIVVPEDDPALAGTDDTTDYIPF